MPLWLFLMGCQSQSGYAPNQISGARINYYTQHTSASCDKNIVGKNVLYEMHQDGTYQSYFEGKLWETGDYSYEKKSANKAQVTMSYDSKSKGVNEGATIVYSFTMTYQSPSKGTWIINYADQNQDLENERGTFEVVLNRSTQTKK